jgi:TMEM175 potassium channel family protein
MPDFPEKTVYPKQRLETLCDGLFAIAMTLMILDLKTPENIPLNLVEEELPGALINLLPAIEAYAISFTILGIFWFRHQLQFKYLKFVDGFIFSLNIFFLLIIGFVPFSVGLKMRYPEFELPYIIYITNLLLIGIILFLQWYYISKHDEISNDGIPAGLRKRVLILSAIPIGIFALSFAVAFVNIRAALFIIYLDPIFYFFYRILFRGKKNKEKVNGI